MKTNLLKIASVSALALAAVALPAKADHLNIILAPHRHHDHARPSRSVEYEVQSALARKGYYHGRVDGRIGRKTQAAIRAYQFDHHLRPTGQIDRSLLRSLRLL